LCRLAPAWTKAAANLNGLVKVAAIDCDEDQNKPICSQYGIQGFPTIKTFTPRADKGKKGNKSVGGRCCILLTTLTKDYGVNCISF